LSCVDNSDDAHGVLTLRQNGEQFAREVTSVSGRAIMKKASDSERILFTIPIDVVAWLRERAKYHGSSLSAEVTRSARERMERERAAANDRAAGSGTAA
jgi:hypothetical protein